ncbi:hypothetical protein F5883DRAFT_105470 [Diaporthe sp. PMI_573]|nr:hypothetical protein F5883DRAFT_105470 [Diaporthaceae sp. PMI_573]
MQRVSDLLHAATLDSDQDEQPPQLPTIFSSFPRVAIHRIGRLYVKLGGGDKPGRVVRVTWRAGLTWCPRVGAGRIPVLSLDQGDGPRTGSGFRRALVGWQGGRRMDQLCFALFCPGLGRAGLVGLGDSCGTQLGIFGQGLSRIIPVTRREREKEREPASVCPFPCGLMDGLWLLSWSFGFSKYALLILQAKLVSYGKLTSRRGRWSARICMQARLVTQST